MPSRKVHNLIAELFGIDRKLANKINRDIDLPSRILGKKHRILFHKLDLPTLLLLSKYKFSPDAILTWALHVYTDELSRDKEFRKLFKLLEILE